MAGGLALVRQSGRKFRGHDPEFLRAVLRIPVMSPELGDTTPGEPLRRLYLEDMLTSIGRIRDYPGGGSRKATVLESG